MIMKNIVVTRPKEDFERSAEKIRALGYNVLHSPMMEFKLLEFELPAIDAFSALIFTSANGVRAVVQSAHFKQLIQLPCYVVGPQSAALAKQYGFKVNAIGNGDVKALSLTIASDYQSKNLSKALLHVSGHHQAGNLVDMLAELTIEVERLQAYHMLEIGHIAPKVLGLIEKTGLYEDVEKIDGILLYSARSAKILFKNLAAAQVLTKISNIQIYCLSKNIAGCVCKPYLKHIYWVKQPNEDALLDLMQQNMKMNDD